MDQAIIIVIVSFILGWCSHVAYDRWAYNRMWKSFTNSMDNLGIEYTPMIIEIDDQQNVKVTGRK